MRRQMMGIDENDARWSSAVEAGGPLTRRVSIFFQAPVPTVILSCVPNKSGMIQEWCAMKTW